MRCCTKSAHARFGGQAGAKLVRGGEPLAPGDGQIEERASVDKDTEGDFNAITGHGHSLASG